MIHFFFQPISRKKTMLINKQTLSHLLLLLLLLLLLFLFCFLFFHSFFFVSFLKWDQNLFHMIIYYKKSNESLCEFSGLNRRLFSVMVNHELLISPGTQTNSTRSQKEQKMEGSERQLKEHKLRIMGVSQVRFWVHPLTGPITRPSKGHSL